MGDLVVEILWSHGSGHDKLWGYLLHHNEYISFWGPRGKSMTFKRHPGWMLSDMQSMARKKRNGSSKYKSFTYDDICEATPGFNEEFDHQFILAVLGNKYHKKKSDAEI